MSRIAFTEPTGEPNRSRRPTDGTLTPRVAVPEKPTTLTSTVNSNGGDREVTHQHKTVSIRVWAAGLRVGGLVGMFLGLTHCGSTAEPPRDKTPSAGNLAASRTPPGGLAAADIPQFITLTFDDSVTQTAIDLITQINQHKQGDCYIKPTFFVAIDTDLATTPCSEETQQDAFTKCPLIQGLMKADYEIATHTCHHVSPPDAPSIQGAITWLQSECGVSLDEMRGFRTPDLNYTQAEPFNELGAMQQGTDPGFTQILYDSSVSEANANGFVAGDPGYGANYIFPYQMDGKQATGTFGIQQDCAASCDQKSLNPGLWELPMYAVWGGAEHEVLTIMDWNSSTSTVTEILEYNFSQRYTGNRAPLGLFFHAAWLEKNDPAAPDKTNAQQLDAWIGSVLAAHSDVYFVTNQELIAWMSNPVPASQYKPSCPGQNIKCFPPATSIHQGCVDGRGTFNLTTCQCDCITPWCLQPDGSCDGTTGCVTP